LRHGRSAAHALHILREELKADMSQLGCATLAEAREITVGMDSVPGAGAV